MKNIFFKFFLFLAFSVLAFDAYAQLEITAPMNNIMFGKPKTVTIYNANGQTTVSEYDIQGRLMSMQSGDVKLVYTWNDNEDEILVEQMLNNKKVDQAYIYINELTPSVCEIETAEGVFTYYFRPNKSIEKSVARNENMSMETRYLYRSEDDVYPYKLIYVVGNQSQEADAEINEVDSLGNIISTTLTNGEVSIQNRREITYYD